MGYLNFRVVYGKHDVNIKNCKITCTLRKIKKMDYAVYHKNLSKYL